MRSRTGCLTCRNRKLKCDERKPVCGQCTKASRECIPSPGVVFRHQQNASMNGGAAGGSTSSLNRFYGYKETFGKNSIWVEIPRQLTFVHTTNPTNEPSSPGSPGALETDPQCDHDRNALAAYPTPTLEGPTHGLEALSAAASGDHHFQPSTRYPSVPFASPSPQRQSTTQATNYLLTQSGSISPPIDPRLHSGLSEVSRVASSALYATQHITTEDDIDPDSDEDVSFLLRYFSEGPGEWMDLFDLGSFFAVDVPLKASCCPILLYAAVALSAKALGRIRITAQHSKSIGSKRTPSEWSHKARYYYDKAITQLRQALENETRATPDTPDTSEVPAVSSEPERDFRRQISSSTSKHATLDSQSLPRTDSDELVATTAILCVYEFLDASGLEWTRHLDGAKSLFDIARDGTMPLSVLPPEKSPLNVQPSTTTKGRRAVFWNICRQEMLNAFINNTSTRLDTADLSMWRSAGLHISQTGFVLPSNDPALHEPMADDMISNALVWLMMKLVNFIAAGDDFPHELGLGIRQRQLLEYWEGLEKQLDVWFEGLPNSFRPSATEWQDRGRTNMARKWFARPMCASTMQSFHFTRIQLLLNKPHISTGASHTATPDTPSRGTTWSLAQRHASYASILRQSRKHAEEIISIGLGITNDGARIHSVQPLFTAGQVLGMREEGEKPTQTEGGASSDKTDEKRSRVLDMLQSIQRETGWATEYRMQQLLEEWGLPNAQA